MQCESANQSHLSKIYRIQREENHRNDTPDVLLRIIEEGLSYIIKDDGRVVGYALILSRNNVTIVHDFVIVKTYQKKGLAYVFWGFIEISVTNENVVLRSNERSRAFWEKNGFETISDDDTMTKKMKKCV